MEPASEVFRSAHHPADRSPVMVFARAFLVPFSYCALPALLVASMRALSGRPVLAPFLGLFAAGYAAAMLWTAIRVRADIAEVHVRCDQVAVRSVWDVAVQEPATFSTVLDLRRDGSITHVGAGDAHFRMEDADWPDAAALLEALRRARHYEPDALLPS